MSYNYDLNPWDDNYTTGNSNQQQQSNYGGYSDAGYSNPLDQYSGGSNPQQYIYQDEQMQDQQQQQQQYSDQPVGAGDQPGQQDSQQPPSAISRFLRQHVPLCGTLMDTISSINLPFIDALVQHVNRDLLVSKIFYFFFYSAFGSLFPLMGVYFKQLGMNPAQVGILTGVRPFIEIFSAPFWHSLADRFHKSKALLLFSLLCWIVFTHSLAHIRPPASACVAFNDTDYVLYTPYSSNDLSNYDVGQLEEADTASSSTPPPNELFMNKMPQSAAIPKDKEVKGEILASEENQNDQRKRRRRRRRKRQVAVAAQQVDGDQEVANQRYVYSIAAGEKDDAYNSHLDLNVDLENDFDDKALSGGVKGDNNQHGAWSFFADSELAGSNGGGDGSADDTDEISQSYLKGARYERSVRDIDDVLGESDEPEPEDDEPQQQSKQKSKGTKMANGAGRQVEEEEQQQAEEEEERGEESGGRREHEPGNRSDQQASRSGSISGTATTNSPEPQAAPTVLPVAADTTSSPTTGVVNKTKRVYKQRHKTPPTHIVGMSPITVEYAVNYNKEKHSQFVTPMFSTIVYKLDDIKEVFFLLLLLISLGEFFSAPALTLADSATLSYLGDNVDLYGRQRMFGSLSWAVTLLLVGMALDNATSIADHPCGPHQRERSYNVCFIIFSLLMACAFLTATQFRFSYPKVSGSGSQQVAGGTTGSTLVASTTSSNGNTIVTTTLDGSTTGVAAGNIDELYASTQPRSIFNTAPPVNAPPPSAADQRGGKEKFEYLDKWKSAVFAQRTWELPEWVNVFRQFRNSLHLTYLFITWFLGCGVGLVFTFLFWHLQDVGGTPTLFGICSVINHISEILAYFFSFHVIKRFGHTRVLSVGLGCNVIRFLYVAFLTDPYYALPFELVQGITHAACFAACCSYISHVSKPELRTSTQGVMQGLHHGIGRACGALLGGYMINAIGSRASFCIYGLLSGCVLAGFLYVRKKASEMEGVDEEVKVDDSEALGGYGAPQGVPSAIPGKLGVGGGSSVVGGLGSNIGSGGGQSVTATQDIDYQW